MSKVWLVVYVVIVALYVVAWTRVGHGRGGGSVMTPWLETVAALAFAGWLYWRFTR